MKSQSSSRLLSLLSKRIFKSYKVHRKKILVYFICLSTLLCVEAAFTFRVQKNLMAVATSANPTALSADELLWEKTYGGAGDDRAFGIVPSGDGGFLVVGSSTSFGTGKTPIGWIVRTDFQGNKLWNKTYEEKISCEIRNAVKINNGFLLVGNKFSLNGDSEGWLLRIDESGNVLWSETLGESGINRIFSATVTTNGYVLVGFVYPWGSINSKAWMIKTDTDGKVQWNRTYGTSGENAFRAILAIENNQYVVAGYTNSMGNGDYDFWLVKTDQSGDVLWSRNYGGPKSDMAYALTRTEEGYMIVGETHSFGEGDANAFVVKTDSDGTPLWEKAYGGSKFDVANAITPSSSGGYVITGSTFSFGKGQRDFWIFKVDHDGEVLWSRTQGREGFEEAYAIVEVAKNQFVLAGWTNSIGNGNYDYYVVKMKAPVSNNDSGAISLSYLILIVLGITVAGLLGFWVFRLKTKEKRKALATEESSIHNVPRGSARLALLRISAGMFSPFRSI
jgi:hypothetical protein